MRSPKQLRLSPTKHPIAIEAAIWQTGFHPPDKVCRRCKAECGPSILPQHPTWCSSCVETLAWLEGDGPRAMFDEIADVAMKAVEEAVGKLTDEEMDALHGLENWP